MNRDPRKVDRPLHWDRRYLMTEATRKLLLSELKNLKNSMIITPDSDASMKKMEDILNKMEAA